MYGFNRQQEQDQRRPAAVRAEQRIAANAAWGRFFDQGLFEEFEAAEAEDNPDYVAVEWVEDLFNPDYYADANQTAVDFETIDAAVAAAENQGRRVSESDILRQALVEAGVPDPTDWGVGNQAHHIVERSNGRGEDILAWAGIEANSAVNGVFLPSGDMDGIRDNLTLHLGSHTQDYTDNINRALEAVRNSVGLYARDEVKQQAMIARLNQIRYVLLTQRVPLNAGSDPGYRPEGTATVEEIFDAAGLFD